MGHAMKDILNRLGADMASVFFSVDHRLGAGLWIVVVLVNPRMAIFAALGCVLTRELSKAYSANLTSSNGALMGLNGIFVGLAAAAFYPAWRDAAIATIALAPLCVIAVIASDRALRVWGLPILVLPYCVALWTLQLFAQEFPAFALTMPASTLEYSPPGIAGALLGGLAGFGQILFNGSLAAGIGIILVFAIREPRSTPPLIASALVPSIVAWGLVGNHWIVTTGLASFPGILLYRAHQARFVETTRSQCVVLIALSGLLEIVVVRLLGHAGLVALSTSYVAIAWIAHWSTETHAAKTSEVETAAW